MYLFPENDLLIQYGEWKTEPPPTGDQENSGEVVGLNSKAAQSNQE